MAQQFGPAQFIAKWSRAELSERTASQEHFLDLCRLPGQPTPAEQDAFGGEYTSEKGVTPTGGASRGAGGERGFADVWWRGKFAWEYKRKGKYRDLSEAYRRLCRYREALENPPLLIVSDIARTEIHTNFTGTAKRVHTVTLDRLAEPVSQRHGPWCCRPPRLAVLGQGLADPRRRPPPTRPAFRTPCSRKTQTPPPRPQAAMIHATLCPLSVRLF